MAKYAFLIMLNPQPGEDDTLNAWLDQHHLPEVMETPGFQKVTRYELTPEDAASPAAKHRYMHLYEIETDDLEKTKAELAAAHASRTPMTPAAKLDDMVAVFFKAR